VAFLLLRRETDRCAEERVYLDALCAQNAALALVYRLSSDFAQYLRERQGEHLDTWLAEAARCEVDALQRFRSGAQLRRCLPPCGPVSPCPTGMGSSKARSTA